ncbi:MAG: class I SAM-dependent methyltransferase [Chthoniobacterales bacterium]|nr:class I SAM-dependent methyltransferase [Chthoniobacterales bacterium]
MILFLNSLLIDKKHKKNKPINLIKKYFAMLEEACFQEKKNELPKHFDFPPGHFYSPIPCLAEIKQDELKIFGKPPRDFPGINLYEEEQLELLNELAQFYKHMPFKATKAEGLRYYFKNPNYSYSDAILLHCMIRNLKPKKIIEIGSGYSSCMTLDTNELYFDGRIKTIFIEPHPNLLLTLINKEDKNKEMIISKKLQDVDVGIFKTLEKNDILFIDSTHVSKVNSDVNHLFSRILPCLNKGVYIHFHDIFYPFEYPQDWIMRGIAWNEIYVLRSFLQYNSKFKVRLMNTFMHYFHPQFFLEKMPLCLMDQGGSIWLSVE